MSKPYLPETAIGLDALRQLERRVTDLERAARLPLSAIGSGGLTVKDGGKITFLNSAGAVLATLDENGVLVAGAPVLLDGDGLQVGTDVVIDSTGLQVIGGYVTPSLSEIQIGQATDVSLTTTPQDVVTLTMTPPSWAQQVYGFVIATAQVSESSSAKNCTMTPRIGTSNFGDRTQGLSTSPATESWTAATSISTDRVSLPSSFNVHCRVNLNTGTNSTNLFNLYAFADYRRTT